MSTDFPKITIEPDEVVWLTVASTSGVRTAIQEGHVRGRFEGPDRFVAAPAEVGPSEEDG